jgi:ectoine hydroxylase-related dioxygenase (phytanoyl-CoA dioxygenase family)
MVITQFDTGKFAFLNTQATWMPTVKAILGEDCDCIYKGVMLSLPGSFPQPWHQDGPHLSEKKHLNAHCLNVFVPLVDLTTANGPTEFVPTTQVLGRFDSPENPVAVCASAGDVVLMDYRIKHRGLGNNSAEPRPLLYITYAKKGWTDRANFSSRRYRALPELDDTDRFQPQVKRKFKPELGDKSDKAGWTVVAELKGGELRATWQSPSPVSPALRDSYRHIRCRSRHRCYRALYRF